MLNAITSEVEIYGPRSRALVWSTVDELKALLGELGGHSDRVTAVAAAGAKRVLGERLYRHRQAAVMKRLT